MFVELWHISGEEEIPLLFLKEAEVKGRGGRMCHGISNSWKRPANPLVINLFGQGHLELSGLKKKKNPNGIQESVPQKTSSNIYC